MGFFRKSDDRLAKEAGWSVNEIQFRVTGVRYELLLLAVDYGLMRAVDHGHDQNDWREWLAYLQRRDAWGRGGSKTEMAERLASASLVTQEDFDEHVREARNTGWWERLESLEESARSVEELSRPGAGIYPLEEMRKKTPGGVALLYAVEDSLVLQLYAEGAERDERADADEIYELLMRARGEGVWEYMQPTQDRYPASGYLGPEMADFDEQETVERIESLFMLSEKAVDFYRELHPDGRELTAGERKDVCQQLVTSAVALRRLGQLERYLASALPEARLDLRSIIRGWRGMQRSLVLALSESEQLRERVYPPDAPLTRDDRAAQQP